MVTDKIAWEMKNKNAFSTNLMSMWAKNYRQLIIESKHHSTNRVHTGHF